jgi:cysteine desulfurase
MIYLDYAATSPLSPTALEAMLPFLTEHYGNPSSLHRPGVRGRKALNQAAETLAACLGADPERMILTSGGSEANNLAILGSLAHLPPAHLITSAVEHSAVTNPCKELARRGWELTVLPVTKTGVVTPESLAAALRPNTKLVSMMHGNNEMGALNDLIALGTLCRERDVLFHTDAVQTAGKLPINLNAWPVDYLSLSAHKFYGPKGVGALLLGPNAPWPQPLMWGGTHQHGVRPGTENVAGGVGMAAALQECMDRMADVLPRTQALTQQLIEGIEAAIPHALLNGPRDLTQRVPGNVHFSFPGVEGEALVLQFDLKGIAVSSGSACHSGKIEPSHVILALGRTEQAAKSTVRFSLGCHTTAEDIARVLAVTPGLVRLPVG